MSLTANGTVFCMEPEHKMTGHHFCNLRNQVDVIFPRVSSDGNMKLRHSLSVEDKSYAVNSFHLFANVLVAFWLFLVAISYFLLSKDVNVFGGFRGKHAEKVSSSDRRTISNATTEDDTNDTFSWSELCTKCDAYCEISDFDKPSYMHSLLSLEGEDSEWLSDSMPYGLSYEDPSTPPSYKCDAYYEISDFEQGSYLHSLLSLDDEDSEWLSDSKSFGCSSENPSTPLSSKCNAYFQISALEKASYVHSLLSLEDEDTEWLSDSKPSVRSFEEPSTPLSYKCDAYYEISDFDKACYMHSLLSLEDEDSEWLSDSKPSGDLNKSSYMHPLISLEDEDSDWLSDSKSYGFSSENSTPLSYKYDAYYEISDLDKASYLLSLLILEDEDSEWLSDSSSWSIVVPPSVSTSSSFTGVQCGNSEEEFSADEPLFWPFEGKLNWNSEEPWSSFCTSPRRRFDSKSTTSRIKGCDKKKGNEALCIVNYETSKLSMWAKSSAKIVPLLECEHFDSNKDQLLLGKEYFDLCQELTIETLVGLKEFDGHEGLDSEFDDVSLLDEYLQ
ncbi:hypothetical protein glysoja_010484 [Glycine soja]|nr:hypothetical protein glysoja_010484 [Glycine soja]